MPLRLRWWQHGHGVALVVLEVESHVRVHLAHLEAELVAKRWVLRVTSCGGNRAVELQVSCTRAKPHTARITSWPLRLRPARRRATHLRPILQLCIATEPARISCRARCSRLLPGHTKLKEYESSEKLASRARSKLSAASALVSRGPIMSATVMSHVLGRLSLLANDAARSATGFMSSAVSSSCARTR